MTMDNSQIKRASLVLLILVIVFSIGATLKVIDAEGNDSLNKAEEESKTVTKGRVAIDIQELGSPQKGEVKIEINPREGELT